MMRIVLVLIAVLISLQGLTACQTRQEKPEPGLYDRYDKTVEDLKQSVDNGSLTVTEAEALRQKAFKEYLEEVKEKNIAMEYRNY